MAPSRARSPQAAVSTDRAAAANGWSPASTATRSSSATVPAASPAASPATGPPPGGSSRTRRAPADARPGGPTTTSSASGTTARTPSSSARSTPRPSRSATSLSLPRRRDPPPASTTTRRRAPDVGAGSGCIPAVSALYRGRRSAGTPTRRDWADRVNSSSAGINAGGEEAEGVTGRRRGEDTMLRNRGIRTKLLALLALPVVLLLVAAVAVSALQLRSAAQAAQVERLASGAGTLGVLVSALQAERSVSQAALDHKPVDAELRIARRATDAALLRVRTVLADVHPTSLSAQATAAVAQAVQAHRTLPGLRAAVDSRTRGRDQVGAGYTAAVRADIDLPERIGDGLQDRGIGSRLTVYSAAQRLAELATQQREVGLQALSGGSAPSLPIASALRTLAAEFAGAEAAYRRGASPQQAHALALALTTPRAARAQLSVQQGALAAGSRSTFTSADWRAVANPRIDALSALAGPVAADVAAVALERATTARDRAVL